MSAPGRENLLLALGNDLLGDDGVALTAARLLRQEFQDEVEVVESAEAGLALVEMLEGYERALLLDAVVTGRCPPGTVLEFSPGDFQKIVAPSPHYAGIPEVLNLAERLGISFPKEIRILALEVESPYEFQERLSPSVEQALPAFVESVRRVLERWKGKGVWNIVRLRDVDEEVAMKTCVLERSGVVKFFERLLEDHEVVAPVEKEKGFYVFAPIRTAAEVVLDYTTTLLPPKKVFFPQRQTLFRFKLSGDLPEMESVIDERPVVLAGVHPCDLAGIRMLDWAFERDHPDEHYLSRRRATTIVGVDCHPDEHCFCAAVGTAAPREGFDLFLTPMEDGYLISVGAEKGNALLETCADTREATPADLAVAGQWQKEKQEKVSRHFETDIYNLPLTFQRGVNSPAWEKVAGPCLSCGACNLVCPSCFCFDVEDVMDPDGAGGVRERVWDGCQFSEFARVAGGGNFRSKVTQRLKHRFYRKYQYLMTLYGTAFCTGCGRCGRFCPVDINIVDTINALVMDDQKEGEVHVGGNSRV